MRRALAMLLIASLAGCAAPREAADARGYARDPFVRALAAIDEDRVHQALALLDLVPMGDRRHRAAQDLRRQLRQRLANSRAHVLRAVALWGGGDEGTIEMLEDALELCGDDDYAAHLLRVARGPAGDGDSGDLAGWGEPVTVAVPDSEPSADSSESTGPAESSPATPVVAATPLAETRTRALRRVRANALRDVEQLLHDGHSGQALAHLDRLLDLDPEDAAVAKKLARILNQQALLCYGQGKLRRAVAYWQRVLTLQPDASHVRRYLDMALSEQRTERD